MASSAGDSFVCATRASVHGNARRGAFDRLLGRDERVPPQQRDGAVSAQCGLTTGSIAANISAHDMRPVVADKATHKDELHQILASRVGGRALPLCRSRLQDYVWRLCVPPWAATRPYVSSRVRHIDPSANGNLVQHPPLRIRPLAPSQPLRGLDLRTTWHVSFEHGAANVCACACAHVQGTSLHPMFSHVMSGAP